MITTFPSWCVFVFRRRFVEWTQRRILRNILRENDDCPYGKQYNFGCMRSYEAYASTVPKCDYEDIEPFVRKLMEGEQWRFTTQSPVLLEPTGGSSTGTKFIPYTPNLKREFQKAVDPWIFALFLQYPKVMTGKHFWSISPSTRSSVESEIPIGFETDSAYLSPLKQFLTTNIMAVPDEINRCEDPVSHEFLTLLFLLQTDDLQLISVWHPSWLLVLLKSAETRFPELVDTLFLGQLPKDVHCSDKLSRLIRPNLDRAKHCLDVGFVPHLLWPHLNVISCWAGEKYWHWTEEIQQLFPTVDIQPKGLLATEGITTFPFGKKLHQPAINSHFYEFECLESGKVFPLWELENGKRYHLILTTSGGLYRYQTNDEVQVDLDERKQVKLHFRGRIDHSSDLFGEKVSLKQAERICDRIVGHRNFAFIAPNEVSGSISYTLFYETSSFNNDSELNASVEKMLCENFHYQHARNLGQLSVATSIPVDSIETRFKYCMHINGKNCGDNKWLALQNLWDWSGMLENSELKIVK